METLEVSHLGLVTGLNEGLEAGLDESAGAAAEHGLFAEEIGLGLFLKGGLQHARPGRADALGPSEGIFLGGLGFVLRDGNERRHAFALGVETTDHVARALGCDHDAIDVLRELDQAEVNREAVAKKEGLALGEIGQNGAGVDVGLLHVGQTDHDDVGPANGFTGLDDLEAVRLGDRLGFRALIKADDDLAAAVLQVERMGVALRTIAEDGERFVFEHAEIGVFVGVDFSGHDEISMRVLWASISERNLALESEATGASEFDNPEWLKQTQ